MMRNNLIVALFLATSLTNFVCAQNSRNALIIGVQNYKNVPPLRNSNNDAQAISKILEENGFEVTTLFDPATKKDIKDAISNYYNLMSQKSGGIGVIYYAGHGLQYNGENYLIPTNASLQIPSDLDDQCLKMNSLMSVINSSENLNILILDACRTNAFPSFNRDLNQGLSPVQAPTGSIVVFATQPGTVASDGAGINGLFTSKLLKYINDSDLNIIECLSKVRSDVYKESGGKQIPSVVDNSIGGEFSFGKRLNVVKSTETNDDSNSERIAPTIIRESPRSIDNDEPTANVRLDVDPQFKGGLSLFYDHLKKNFHYPATARRLGIEGKVYVGFVVNKDGSTSDIQVLKGIHPSCDQVALEAVAYAPQDWIPGKINNSPVKVRLQVPIIFKLTEE